ncbi:type VII toxin-antitoxin system HepT family RNase toxin [Desulfotomaculum copahuensis]|uniref:Polymerase beta nucleotidyltransferase domain-containing protein n=1 Tax=Desulfotomaculum copahuensis TaxID=1838280 RepID=A0A1B7LKH6_9FIRM|nr:HepT-like ribonuclease domain-containing protein [Desulfotomaculum copahuensis]OAT87084.1 hypothetical protein A6M21_01995 [Desulfotomaculum copahuensis]
MQTVTKRLLQKLQIPTNYYHHYGIVLSFIFGSTIEKSALPPADLDVAVLFSQYDFQSYLQAGEDLGRQLNRRDLDLVVLNLCSPALKMDVLTGGFLHYSKDDETFARFAVDTFFDYEEYLYFKREYQIRWRKRTREGLLVATRQLHRERVETCLSQLDQAVQRLKDLSKRFSSFEEFTLDLDTRELCVHHLRIALESVLDICRHFLAVKGVALNEFDTTALIELAGEKGLLDRHFAHRIKGMAGMRNAIVHVYWRLDYAAIHRAVANDLPDFAEFARQVTAYLVHEEKKQEAKK